MSVPESDLAVSASHSRGRAIWLLILILAVSAACRIWRLGEVNYWFDESSCVKMAEFSVPEICVRNGRDTHPPLYFVLLKCWSEVVGTSPTATRSLSLLLGLATVTAIYLFVCEGYRHTTQGGSQRRFPVQFAALLAAFLVGMSPLQISWSQQVRMYALGTCLTAFSSWFLMRALLRDGRRRGDWRFYTATATMLAYTHYYGLFTLFAQFVFAAVYCWFQNDGGDKDNRWTRLRPVVASAAMILLLWSPWMPTMLAQRVQVAGDFWTKPLDWETFGQVFLRVFGPHERGPANPVAGLFVAQGLVVLLVALLLGRRLVDVYVVLAATLPILFGIMFSITMTNILVPRYLIFAHPFSLVALAVLLARIRRNGVRHGFAVLVVAGAVGQCWLYQARRAQMAEKGGMRVAMAKADETRRPNEPLIVCSPMLYTSAIAYSQRRDDIFVYRSSYHYSYFLGTALLKPEEYFDAAELSSGRYSWVWTLDYSRSTDHAQPVPMGRNWLQVGEARIPEWYCELVLRLYEWNGDASSSE